VTATSGFYVRALARDLGEAAGCGAHLVALRRTAIGPFDVARAVGLEEAERLGRSLLRERVLSPAAALPHLPAVTLTAGGLGRALHGNPLGPHHLTEPRIPAAAAPGVVKILDGQGRLVALGRVKGGTLHPVVVLG